MDAGLPSAREDVSRIRVRTDRELLCLGLGSDLCERQPLEVGASQPETSHCSVYQEPECVTPKREPREQPEPAVKSAGLEEFEFVGVKQEPVEEPEDNEFFPQEPECILEQKDEECIDIVRTGELRPTQEPECIIVQKEEPCDGGEQPGELNSTQVQENGVQQKAADLLGGDVREEEEILGLVPEPEWVPPCVPASEEAVRDPLAAEGDGVTDSSDEEVYTSGWSHTSHESQHISSGEVNYDLSAVVTANGGGPSFDSFAARSYGTEPVQRVFRCDSCSTIFSTKYHIVIHVFTHIPGVPPPSHVCRWCAEVFGDTASLIKHSKGHENRLEVPAVLAKRSKGPGRSVGGKRRHRLQKPLETKPHICDLCGKAFPFLGNLNLHKRTHSGERPYVCEVCGKTFVQRVHLRNHRVTHTAEKRHYCEFCGRAFALVHTLKVHLRLHTGENPYRCDECGATFTLLGKLKTHQQSHTGRKPFRCDECGNFFAAPNSLRRHKRMHSGEKPYSCDLCGESFMWSATLQRHKQLHTGEKPFKCDLCSSSFAEMGGLNRHMRIHTGERPYACNLCGASFTVSNHLKRHVHKQHVENPSVALV